MRKDSRRALGQDSSVWRAPLEEEVVEWLAENVQDEWCYAWQQPEKHPGPFRLIVAFAESD
jgi:hypothetical protein